METVCKYFSVALVLPLFILSFSSCREDCIVNAECANGFSCINGACVSRCTSSYDCGSGVCVDGLCIVNNSNYSYNDPDSNIDQTIDDYNIVPDTSGLFSVIELDGLWSILEVDNTQTQPILADTASYTKQDGVETKDLGAYNNYAVDLTNPIGWEYSSLANGIVILATSQVNINNHYHSVFFTLVNENGINFKFLFTARELCGDEENSVVDMRIPEPLSDEIWVFCVEDNDTGSLHKLTFNISMGETVDEPLYTIDYPDPLSSNWPQTYGWHGDNVYLGNDTWLRYDVDSEGDEYFFVCGPEYEDTCDDGSTLLGKIPATNFQGGVYAGSTTYLIFNNTLYAMTNNGEFLIQLVGTIGTTYIPWADMVYYDSVQGYIYQTVNYDSIEADQYSVGLIAYSATDPSNTVITLYEPITPPTTVPENVTRSLFVMP